MTAHSGDSRCRTSLLRVTPSCPCGHRDGRYSQHCSSLQDIRCDFVHSFYIFVPFGQNSVQKIFTKILSGIVEFTTNRHSQAHFVLSAVNKIPFTVQCGCSAVQAICTKCCSGFGSFMKIGVANVALSL